MGGSTGTQTGTQNQTQNQFQQGQQAQQQAGTTAGTSQLTPWATALPQLTNILSGLSNTNLTPFQGTSGDLLNSGANNLLSGGGFNQYAPYFQNAYSNLTGQLGPLTNPANLNPFNTPGFSDAYNTLKNDITTGVNQSFAGAGRDLSGDNTIALSRGLSQGLGGLIQSQYNQNVGNLLNASGQLFGAGQGTGQNLAGLNTSAINAFLQGIPAANAGTGTTLQNFLTALNIANPLAQGYGQQTYGGTTTGTTSGTQSGIGQGTQVGQTTQTLSPIQQLSMVLASLPKGGPSGTGTTGGGGGGWIP